MQKYASSLGPPPPQVLCEHYWPATSTPVTHGHITIHLLAEEPEDEWTRREFQLQHVCAQGPGLAGKAFKLRLPSPGPHGLFPRGGSQGLGHWPGQHSGGRSRRNTVQAKD